MKSEAPAEKTEAPKAEAPAERAEAPAEKPAAAPMTADATTAAAAPEPTQISVGDVTITGEQFEMDPATGLITVTGNPRAVRADEEIRATRMIINPRTSQFTAEGDVIIRQAGREFHSTRATYNFQQRSGQAENVTTQIKAYHINAEQFIIKPGPTYEGRRARFSTCDREHRHYEIYSRVLDIVPQEEMVAHQTGIDFLGIRLITIPEYTKSLREGQKDPSRLPTFGYSGFTGPYVRENFNIHKGGPVWVDADVQLNTWHEPEGGFRFGTPGNFKFVGTVFYRDDADFQRAPHLEVSRLPELAVIWSPDKEVRPGRFLGETVQSVRYPNALDISRKWYFAVEADAGFFRQHHGERLVERDGRSQWGARALLQGQAVLPLVKLGPISLNDLRFIARGSTYDTGDTFATYGFGIGKKFEFGNWMVRADYYKNFTAGSTPFLFDDVELKEEVRPRIRFRTPGFEFEYYARIGANSGELFDNVFSVSKLFHCIRPTLTYSTRRNEIFMEIRIPGLSGKATSRPGESKTRESEDPERRPDYIQPSKTQP
jgi:hypothetical protein